MRLLITTDAVGGVWTFTQELTAGLLAAGCHVALASIGRAPSSSQTLWVRRMQLQCGDSFHFICINAPLEWQQDNDAAMTTAAERLLQIAKDFGAELMHSSQFCFGALSASLPVVVTAHSDVLSWAANCRDRPLEDTPWLRRYKTLVSQGLHSASALVAPTHWMLHALAAGFALPPEQVVIANGRTLDGLSTSPERKLQAVTAGRLWDEAKNIEMLTDVVSPMPILVAGERAQAVAEPAIKAGISMLGPLAEPDLLTLLRESEIYLCTSRYEPFGLAPLEAALCGCAVLANDIPSLREVWGDAPLYFRDAASLSSLLHQLADDRHLLRGVQARCAQRARHYTAAATTAAYQALYGRLLHQAETRRAA